MEYIIVGILLFIFSIKYDLDESHENEKKVVFYFALLSLVFFMGLRYRIGLDSIRYENHFYFMVPFLSDLTLAKIFNPQVEPLFLISESVVKSIFNDFVLVQLFQSFVVNVLVCLYFKKHCKYVFMCMFIYYIWRYLPFTTEELRAALAISISLYANDYFIKKKYLKASLLVLLAMGFHSSALVIFLVVLVKYLKFNKYSFLVLLALVLLLVLGPNIFDLLDRVVFSQRMHHQLMNYSNSSLLGQTLSIFGILALLIIYGWYTFMAVFWLKKNSPLHPILKFESIFVWGLIVVLASIPLSLLYRIARFYDIYFIMLFASFIGCNVESTFRIDGKKNILPYVLFIPFFFLSVYTYSSKVKCYEDVRTISRIYPYETVFSRNIDMNRERLFRCYGLYFRDYNFD